MKLKLVSTFGPNIRGVSPYSDGLSNALESVEGISLQRIDFARIDPPFVSPRKNHGADNEYARLDIVSPRTWSVDAREGEIIHLQYWNFLTLPVYLNIAAQAKSAGAKVIMTMHNPEPHESLPLIKRYENKLISRVDLLVVHTEGGREKVLKRGMNPLGVEVIPHGIDACLKSDVSRQKQILFFGNLRHYKGVDLLLSTWNDVKSDFPDFRLIVAGSLWSGSGPIKKMIGLVFKSDAIRKQVESYQQMEDPQMEFHLEFVEERKLRALMDQSCLAIFPYRHFESQSGAAAKAAARGLPILVSDVGGLSQYAIDDRFIFPAGDKDELKSRLVSILKHLEVDLASVAADLQRKKASKFLWSKVATQHMNLYQKIANDKG